MKLITAVIQPQRIDAVKAALGEAGVHGLTVSEARGYGRQRGYTEVYRGAKFAVDLLAKTRVEVLVADEDAHRLATVVVDAARSGQIGDGKVWISPVEEVIRVRTGTSGEDAL